MLVDRLDDLRPAQQGACFIAPFLGHGQSNGIHLQIGVGITECKNCHGVGIHYDIDGEPGPCWRCGGLGETPLGDLYPVLARVLAVHPSCREVAAGDVVHLVRPNCYEWIHLEDGRSFAWMDERNADALIEGYDEAAA